ncbi:MAG: hypothetical protein ACRDMH_07070 [Solirubrobacterales bacterium]
MHVGIELVANPFNKRRGSVSEARFFPGNPVVWDRHIPISTRYSIQRVLFQGIERISMTLAVALAAYQHLMVSAPSGVAVDAAAEVRAGGRIVTRAPRLGARLATTDGSCGHGVALAVVEQTLH